MCLPEPAPPPAHRPRLSSTPAANRAPFSALPEAPRPPEPPPPLRAPAPAPPPGPGRVRNRAGMGFIGAHGVETLKRYKYSGEDRSVVAKYVLQPFWSRCVTLFPLWMP
nr:unnamed protein product [Digitaria exilis]